MATYAGYSAEVSLRLIVNGQTLVLSQVGPADFVVRAPCDSIAESCDAELVISVDGNVKARHVFLPQGVQAGLVPYI
ncbi:MAG TPA: hypothetical protein VHD36_07900 [Pirellulales bacterium]|nr:hypothetical protein [Pirellulales bacterium]